MRHRGGVQGDNQVPKPTLPPQIRKERDPGQQANYLLFYDELTGLYNRRFYNRTYEEQTRRAREEQRSLALILIDVDFFKSINDRYGHQQGDAVLAGAGNLINEVVGMQGYPIRYAGDEFCVLLPGLTRDEATAVAVALGTRVREHPFKLLNTDRTVKITFSTGVAHFPDDTDEPEKVFENADHAAYIAKKQGRDQVVNYHAGAQHVLDATTLYHYFPCSKLVGRTDLVAELHECLSGPTDAASPWAILGGAAGSGKTRMMQELCKRVDKQRRVLLETVGLPVRSGQPFGFLVDAIGAYLRENPQAGQQVASSLNTVEIGAVSQLIPDLSRYALLAGHTSSEEVEAPESGDPLLEPLCKVLLTLARGRAMSMLFDDFHRADQGTMQVLRLLREREPRIFVCVSIRDDAETLDKNYTLRTFVNLLVEGGDAQFIRLEPFDFDQVGEMLEAILPGACKRPDLAELILEKSHGMPLLIEEVLKFLIVQKSIYYEGPELIIENVARDLIPTDADRLLQMRAGQVDEEIRSLMARAAVIGETFDFSTLMMLEGRDEGYLRGILERARKAHVVSETWANETNQISFVSMRTHVAFYEELEEEERRKLHLKLARLREWQYSGQLDSALTELSFHYRRAGDTARAAQYQQIVEALYSQFARPADEGKVAELKDLVTEEKLSEEVLAVAVDALGEFKGCLQRLKTYGSEHVTRKGFYEKIKDEFDRLLLVLPEVTFAEADKNLIINGTLLPAHQRYAALVDVFTSHAIKGITFKEGVTAAELRACLEFLGLPRDELRARGGLGKLLIDVGVTHIVPNEKLYVAVGERDILLKRTGMRDEMLIKEVEAPEDPVERAPALPAREHEPDSAPSPEAPPLVVSTVAARPMDLSEVVDPRMLAHLSSEMAQWQREMARYTDLRVLGALGRDWRVLARDLESGNRVKIAAACKAYMDLDKESVDHLVDVVRSTADTRARHVAISLLRRLMPDAMDHLLRQLYLTQVPIEKCNLLEGLENFQDPALAGEVAPFVRHADRAVRQSALRFLTRPGVQGTPELLIDILGDDREEARLDVVVTIGREKMVQAVPALLKMVDRTSIFFFESAWRLQGQACIALGQLGAQSALPAIKEVLARQSGMYRTKPAQVRVAAITAMLLLTTLENQRSIIAELQKYLNDPDTVVKLEAQKAVQMLQKEPAQAAQPGQPTPSGAEGGEIRWRSIRRTE